MQAKLITQNQREEWNALAAQEPSFALLQSWEWGEFKSKLGWKVFRVAVEEGGQLFAGAQVLIKPLPAGIASIAYVPRGPIGSWLENEAAPLLLAKLHQLAHSHRAVFLKVEPPLSNDPSINIKLKEHNFISNAQTNQPCATLILDLTQDIDMIYKSMRKKTRYDINSASKEGIVVRTGDVRDLPAFFDLMQKTGKREHFPIHSRAYYEYEWKTLAAQQENALLMAYYQERLIAFITVNRFDKHAAEFHAGSVDRFSRLHPNNLLVWKAIQWAKDAGCLTYDLWGIPDEIAKTGQKNEQHTGGKGLWGVYQFKRGFTRNVVCYAGAFDYVYNWPIYRLITSRLFNSKMVAGIAVLLDSFKNVRGGFKMPGGFAAGENREQGNA